MINAPLNILDIDLDFFLNNKYLGSVTSEKRLDPKEYIPWQEYEVIEFLEKNCGLRKETPVRGAYFRHHVDVFYFLRKLQEQNDFALTFNIDHVDAHGDLGTGDTSYIYISSILLAKPVKERAYPDVTGNWNDLSSGNYLAFAAACRWLARLRYINNIDWADDTQWFNLKDFKFGGDTIQLKQFSIKEMTALSQGYLGPMDVAARKLSPISVEPEIPLEVIDFPSFTSSGDYDYVLLTQSPGFTPRTSDRLISVIESYMRL